MLLRSPALVLYPPGKPRPRRPTPPQLSVTMYISDLSLKSLWGEDMFIGIVLQF